MKKFIVTSVGLLSIASLSRPSDAATLNLGADYLLRGVTIEERDKTIEGNDYYDQRLQAYLITDLSKDVEATIRVQSITPWGQEGSTTSLATRYPDANGNFWVQNAFVRLPNLFGQTLALTVGRQPIVWGDGEILSDDELGFNAIRANFRSPWRNFDFDLDAFTAKITEGLQTGQDTDLHGVLLGYDREVFRWEFMGLLEKSDVMQNYSMGAETTTVTANEIERQILGVRARTQLKDAFLKGAYYMQSGKVKRFPAARDVDLGGTAFLVGLGGKQDTQKIGRFGAILEYAAGDGDDVASEGEDEAFRPTFARRWSGLEREGYGYYMATTFSDAYSPSNPFGPASSTNTGLPPGTSGIRSIHFGVELTPWAAWTFNLDYFTYKAQENLAGPKDLGTEFDYTATYRYSGLVSARVTHATFNPKDAFDVATRRKASRSTAEIDIRF